MLEHKNLLWRSNECKGSIFLQEKYPSHFLIFQLTFRLCCQSLSYLESPGDGRFVEYALTKLHSGYFIKSYINIYRLQKIILGNFWTFRARSWMKITSGLSFAIYLFCFLFFKIFVFFFSIFSPLIFCARFFFFHLIYTITIATTKTL